MMSLDYDRYCLKCNPFLVERHDYQLIGMQRQISQLRRYLISCVKVGGVHFIVIKGSYGLGKTKLLFELVKRPNQFLGECKVLLPQRYLEVPIRFPKRILSDWLLPHFFMQLGLERLRGLKEELEHVANQMQSDSDSLLEDMGIRYLGPALLALGTEHDHLAWRWFSREGGALNISECRRLGAMPIKTDEDAENVLVEFLIILKKLGYSACIVPIDEFEYVSFQSSAVQLAVTETLRGLETRIVLEISEKREIAGLTFVLTITPEAWDRLVERLKRSGIHGFIERVEKEKYYTELEALETDQVKELIVTRLQADRSKEPPYPLFPFEYGYPEHIDTYARGKPRFALSYSGIILDEGLLRGLRHIRVEDAESILREREIVLISRSVERVR